MVKLNRIYTRGGDQGETSLGDGTRLEKHNVRVAAYGTVDEANATIGLARTVAGQDIEEVLDRIQNDLFDLGADLCTPQSGSKAKGGEFNKKYGNKLMRLRVAMQLLAVLLLGGIMLVSSK